MFHPGSVGEPTFIIPTIPSTSASPCNYRQVCALLSTITSVTLFQRWNLAYPFPESGAPVLTELQDSRRGKREANCDFRTTWVSLLGSSQDRAVWEQWRYDWYPWVIERRELDCPEPQADSEEEVSEQMQWTDYRAEEMGTFLSTGFRGFQNGWYNKDVSITPWSVEVCSQVQLDTLIHDLHPRHPPS